MVGKSLLQSYGDLFRYGLNKYEQVLPIFDKILRQTRMSKDNIYSIHKPFTTYIAKRKAHKRYKVPKFVSVKKIDLLRSD